MVPYLHGVSHGLKEMGKRVDVTVVFSALNQLSKLCRNVNLTFGGSLGCTKKHQNRFVECTGKVVSSIPLSCGKQYVGQTGRCLNDRLREHYYDVNRVVSGHLGIQDLKKCSVIGWSSNDLTREIVDAEMIACLKEDCVSALSVFLSGKELEFLAWGQNSRWWCYDLVQGSQTRGAQHAGTRLSGNWLRVPVPMSWWLEMACAIAISSRQFISARKVYLALLF